MYVLLVFIIIILIMIVYIQYDFNKKYKIKIKELKIDNKLLMDKVIISSNKNDSMSLDEKIEEKVEVANSKKEDIKIIEKKNNFKHNKVTSSIEISKGSLELDNFVNKGRRILFSDTLDNVKYLSRVSSKLENSDNIKLTDFEQKEEDNAIISYRELINHNKEHE